MTLVAMEQSPDFATTRGGELRTNGCVAIPGALAPSLLERLVAALDRVDAEERGSGRVTGDAPVHLLGGIARDDAFLELLDHPAVFPTIWGELGWNVHLYHCHLDVTPPRAMPRRRPVWGWHQDGGRLNVDLETEPRPRVSIKVAYWLSDLTEPGRGNIHVIPGSHERNTLPRPEYPELGFEQPEGAEPVMASAGTPSSSIEGSGIRAATTSRRSRAKRSSSPTRSAGSARATTSASTVRARGSGGSRRSAGSYSATTPCRSRIGESAGIRSHCGSSWIGAGCSTRRSPATADGAGFHPGPLNM